VNNLQDTSELGDMSRMVRRVRSFFASTLRERAPRIYSVLRPNPIQALFPAGS
jgi:hypothetical protein